MIAMRSKHIFALIALILGIVGGILLCKGAADFMLKLLDGSKHASFESLVFAGIGVVVIVASVMLWTGRYMHGGVINMVLGIIAVFYGKDSEGIMVLISGVLGFIAPKVKD